MTNDLVKADYGYFVDWNGNGVYDHPLSDISAYVLTSSWEVGSDSQEPGQAKPGSCRLTLDNSTSIFSPDNLASPLYGLVRPGLRLKITMTVPTSPTNPVTMWAGDLESIDPVVGAVVQVSTATLVGCGILGRTSDSKVDLAMQTNIASGDAVKAVLAAAGILAADYDVDPGCTVLTRFWVKEGSTLDVLRQLEAAEVGLLRETKDGKLGFEDRAHRLNPPHTAVQSTYGAGALRIWSLKQQNSMPGIFNYIATKARTFNKSAYGTLCTIVDAANGIGAAPIPVDAGVSPAVPFDIWIECPSATSPAEYLAVDTWGVIDYEVNTAADGSGTDITEFIFAERTEYGNKIKLTFTNYGPQAGYFILLRANGVAVVEGEPIPVEDQDTTSQTKYRKRTYPAPSDWITDPTWAKLYCGHLIALYKDPRTWLTFELKANYDQEHLLEAQQIDISDRKHVTAGAEFGLYVDEDFFVERLAHSVDEARLHTVQITLGKVVTHLWPRQSWAYGVRTSRRRYPPSNLFVSAFASGLRVTFGGKAREYNQGVFEAEFRCKYVQEGSAPDYVDLRTVDEDGTLVHDGINEFVVTGRAANWNGSNYIIDQSSVLTGRIYYAWRFRNEVDWSLWSDGNPTPSNVTDYVSMEDVNKTDNGPPSVWSGTLRAGPSPYTLMCTITRPEVNGNKILVIGIQLRDKTVVGKQHEFDANDSEAVVYYDGSAIAHDYDPQSGTIARQLGAFPDPSTWDDAIIMADVRGAGSLETFSFAAVGKIESNSGFIFLFAKSGSSLFLEEQREVAESVWYEPMQGFESTSDVPYFDVHHTQWVAVAKSQIVGGVISQASGFRPAFSPDETGVYRNIRLKIVRAPWVWGEADGYFGAEASTGWGYLIFWDGNPPYDEKSESFEVGPIPFPSWIPIENIEARALIENPYSRSDDDEWFPPAPPEGSGATGGTILDPEETTVETDAALDSIFFLTMTGDRLLANPTNAKNGQAIAWVITQDEVGSHVLSFDDGFNFGTDVPDAVLSTGVGARDYLGVIYNEATNKFDVVAFVRGY